LGRWVSCSLFFTHATGCEAPTMIWITAIVTVFLFVYLLAALLRPEKF
jgi:K+-transporting ATPase KdpF subunit